MPKSQLELRSLLWIGLAYILGPVCGLTAWAGVGLCFIPGPPDANLEPVLIILAVGVPACLLVEVVVVTPILFGFHRFRWWWLNGWSAAAIGFLLAVAVWALLFHALPSDPQDPPPDVWQVASDWTLPGWAYVATTQVAQAAWWGVIGLVAAVTFRLVAVRPSLLPANLWQL